MPEKKDKTSFLSAAMVAAPTVVGAGVSAKNILATGGPIPPTRSSVERAMDTLYDISRRAPIAISPEDHIRFMNQEALFFSTPQGAEAARTAWLQAVKGADPIIRAPFELFNSRIQALPSEQVPSAITDVMSRQRAEFADPIYRKYYRNLEVLRSQKISAGFVSPEPIPEWKSQIFPPHGIKQAITPLEQAMGPSTFRWRSREWAEEGLGLWRISFESPLGRKVNFMLPNVSQGMLVEGATLQTRYIAPDIGVLDPATKELKRMTRSEFLLKEIEESVLPDINTGRLQTEKEIEAAIQEARRRVIHTLEVVPNIPTHMQTPAMKEYINLRSQAIDIRVPTERRPGEGPWKYTSAFRQPTEAELIDVMERHGLYGGVSPKMIAGGRLQTQDISQRFMVPEATNWGRRPESYFREWGLTAEAAESMSNIANGRYARYRTYEAAANRAAEDRLLRPNLKALYLDPERYAALMQEAGMGEGEAIARASLAKHMTFEATGWAHLSQVREDLIEKLMAGEAIDLTPGEIIGWTERGDPFVMKQGMRDFRVFTHENIARGQYYSLYFRDVRNMRSADKFFGDIKALVHLEETGKLRERIKKQVSTHRFLSDTDIIASMDELRKDTGKHTRQIMSSLGETISFKASREALSDASKLYYANPERVAEIWRRLSTTRGMYSHKKFVEEAMKFAVTEAGVRPGQFGAIFGAVPAVFGQETAEKLVRGIVPSARQPEFIAEMSKGFAGGIAKVAYGGPAELTGAGARGSLEPRAFDILRGPAFAGIGAPLSEEFARRLEYTNPEKLAVHKAVSKTLRSIAGEERPGVKEPVWRIGEPGYVYKKDEFDKFIRRGGGWIKPGKNLNPVYVPGADVVEAMRSYQVGGKEVVTDLAGIYHRMASKLGGADPAQVNIEMELAARELWKQVAPGGKGIGAVLRGDVTGSRFLRGVSRVGKTMHVQLAEKSANAMVAGLPAAAAQDMFSEMERMYGKRAMAGMREAFFRGEEIGGVLARHPFIGEFSLQPVRFKMIEGAGDQIVIPEILTNVRLRGEQSAKPRTLRIGPLVGMAGDKDADIFSAMLVSPDNEKLVRNASLRQDSEFLKRYAQHQVRYQLIKAGKGNAAADELLTAKQLMAGDVRKLGAGQRQVGRLSVELSAARRAIRATASGTKAADALALTEWLEQHLLAAKHMSAAEAKTGALEALTSEVVSSLEYRKPAQLQAAIETIVKDDAVARELLTGKVTIEEGAEALARWTGVPQKEISGVNIQSAVSTITESMQEHLASGEARRAELLVDRGKRLTIREIPEIVAKGAAQVGSGMHGVFSNVSRAAVTASNYLGSIGRSAIKNYKPLGIGFAASLGIAAMLSRPEEIIGPGRDLIPSGRLSTAYKAAGRMQPEDVMPPQQPIGQPTAPNMLNTQRAMVSQNRGSQYVVNATAPPGSNAAGIAGQLSGMHGNVNVNLRDSRDIVNPYTLANKVF